MEIQRLLIGQIKKLGKSIFIILFNFVFVFENPVHELLCQLLQNLPLYVKDIPAITGMSNTETQFQWFPLLYSNLVAFVHEQDSRKHRQN